MIDLDAIQTIAKRAEAVSAQHGVELNTRTLRLALVGAAMECPIDWDGLAAADDFNLMHDALGIIQHFNPTTGELENCFLPRFALNQ